MSPAVTLRVPFEGRELHADTLTGASPLHLFGIHGGGASNRSVWNGLRQSLWQRGVGSTALDCVGHGSTGGVFAESSLQRRSQQARSVIEHAGVRPTALAGISMGAYNALRLSEELDVQALILIVPGIYTPEAHEVPFGPDFSTIIRRPRSWIDSDAWDILGRFRGRLLVIAGEQDSVIPLEIPERLHAAAGRASQRELLVVPGAGHKGLLPQLLDNPQWRASLLACVGLQN
ncbi:alpha/beta fold hydrolase [Pseudomonas sp. YH-1]|uniref:alpha/beta fold hydrolase n=1 Tax=Pseudomonas sp. YH-1 TaxID=3384787 RepID=UPI003F7EAD37